MQYVQDAAKTIGKSRDAVYRYLRNTTPDEIYREVLPNGRTAVDVNALATYSATAKPGRPRNTTKEN